MANPILVTGAACRVGGVGRTITELLLQRGRAVWATVRNEGVRFQGVRDMGAEVVVGNLLDLDSLPADKLGDFLRSLAHRIARFPAAGHITVKERVNAILPPAAENIRRDFDLFMEGVRNPEAQKRIQDAQKHGLHTREVEMALARMLADG